jgi:hypothetical protein
MELLMENLKDQTDPWTMYLIFNEELLQLCSRGKIAAQIGHAVELLTRQYEDVKLLITECADELASCIENWKIQHQMQLIIGVLKSRN